MSSLSIPHSNNDWAPELRTACDEFAQTESIVGSAVQELYQGFEGIAEASRAQQTLLESTLSNVNHEAEDNQGIEHFINKSEELVSRVATGLDEACRRTFELTHQLQTTEEVLTRLDKLSASIGNISEQIRYLALNASIQATSAGTAGRGSAIVASAIKDLSRDFTQLKDHMHDTIVEARASLSTTISTAESAARKDQGLTANTRNDLGVLHNEAEELAQLLEGKLEEARSRNTEIQGGVNQCLRGLQFEDLVRQLCTAARERLEQVTAKNSPSEHDLRSSCHEEEPSRETQKEITNLHPVHQRDLTPGDVEFF